MHRPCLELNRSSYFDYEIYPFVRPPEMDGRPEQAHPVVVVGAGPVGLVAAIQLTLNGIPVVVIEAEAQVSGGSRALALTKRSMEIVEQCGVADEFRRHAIVWSEGWSFHRGTVVHNLRIPGTPDDKFAPMTNLAQCVMEKIFVDRARALGVDIRFQTRLSALEVSADGARLTLDTPQGAYELDARWVIAADGARSTVRRFQGIRYEGESYESRFVIADFNMKIDAPPGRRCYFDPPWLPGHTVLMHKAPRDVWRLDYQVPDGVSDEVAIDSERIHAHISAHLAYIGVEAPWTLEWTTIYKPNALTLGRYDHGPVLYCGDAAHLLPVFGVRGMNTGIQDAMNLAWKLAMVLKGQATAEILETYSDERVADARQICVDAGKSTRMVAPPTRGHRIMQRAVLSLAEEHEFVRELLNWRTSRPIDYADSRLTVVDATEAQFGMGPRPGAPALNSRLDPDDSDSPFLMDPLTQAFHVLVFGDDPALWADALQDVRSLQRRNFPIRLVVIRTAGTAPEADASLLDPQGYAQARWDATEGAVYVLRPDQHVCARWRPGSAARVAHVIDTVIHASSPVRRAAA